VIRAQIDTMDQVPVAYRLIINVIQKKLIPQGLCRIELELFGITHPRPAATVDKRISIMKLTLMIRTQIPHEQYGDRQTSDLTVI
jgi:hypothetical protein